MRKVSCPKCGNEVFETERVCPRCGNVIARSNEAQSSRETKVEQNQRQPQPSISAETTQGSGVRDRKTQPRYYALRIIAALVEVIGILMLLGGVFMLFKGANSEAKMNGVFCIAASISMLAYGEIIQVVVAMEENIRANEENTHKILHLIEQHLRSK